MYALIISSVIVLLYALMYYVRWRLDRRIHAIKMRHERNEQVYLFRWYVLHTWGFEAYKQLPEWEELLESDKPLLVKEWVDVDKLVNLN